MSKNTCFSSHDDGLKITEDEFYQRYNLVQNHLDNSASFDGFMFETYGPELEHVTKMHRSNQAWTIIESDNSIVVKAGFYFINRIGYLITDKPYKSINEYFIDPADEC